MHDPKLDTGIEQYSRSQVLKINEWIKKCALRFFLSTHLVARNSGAEESYILFHSVDRGKTAAFMQHIHEAKSNGRQQIQLEE